MNGFRCFSLLLLALVSLSAQAITLQIGHFAPGSDRVDVYIDNQRVAAGLAYRQLAAAEVAGGRHQVELRWSGTGTPLLSTSVRLIDVVHLNPLLVVAGEPGAQTLFAYQDGIGSGRPQDSFNPVAVVPQTPVVISALVNLASRTDPNNRPRSTGSTCRSYRASDNSLLFTSSMSGAISMPPFGKFDLRLGVPGWSRTSSPEVLAGKIFECDLSVDFVVGPSAFLTTRRRSALEIGTRILAIGNGHDQPYDLIEIGNQGIVAETSTSPETGEDHASKSKHVWRDIDRRAHSVSLFELAGPGLVYGTWQTFETDGTPTWFMLEGAASDLPGRRELQVGRLDDAQTPARFVAVATAQLIYIDCNRAEMRVSFFDGGRRTLRLQRTVDVANCGVLDG